MLESCYQLVSGIVLAVSGYVVEPWGDEKECRDNTQVLLFSFTIYYVGLPVRCLSGVGYVIKKENMIVCLDCKNNVCVIIR